MLKNKIVDMGNNGGLVPAEPSFQKKAVYA